MIGSPQATAYDQYTCPHEQTELRARTIRGGSIQRVKQCLHCGAKLGQAVKGVGQFKPFDEQLLADYQARCKAVQLAAEQERVTERARESAEWKQRYSAYLRTDKWKKTRQLVMMRAGGICEGCRQRNAVEVHHLTYEHVCDEFLFELAALCRACHSRYHTGSDQNDI